MTSTNFILNQFIEKIKITEEPLKQFKDIMIKNNIHYKDYPEYNLILLFTKYKQNTNSELVKECRSIILERSTLNIIAYSCNVPLYNQDAVSYLLTQSEDNTNLITKCYEGTLISIFNYNNKWFSSTRRCLNCDKSVWKSTKSHHAMFLEALNSIDINLEDFYQKLNVNYQYYFILIHHENKNVVDYTNQFGDNYKKIAIGIVRDKAHKEINLYEENLKNKLSGLFELIQSNKIILPEKYEDLTLVDEENSKGYINIPPLIEGLVMKVIDEKTNRNLILKFQTHDYQFIKTIGSSEQSNIFKGFLKLYQLNKLSYYLKNKNNFQLYKKIINPDNNSESFDTIGVVDSVFKVITSELFELFKLLWDLKTNKHKNKELYDILANEYKVVLFGIRGEYFKNKAEFINLKKNNENINNKFYFLKIKHIYNFLKNYDINKLEQLLKARKLMFNLCNLNKDDINLNYFNNISKKCDSFHLKLINLYTIKLYPEIMPTDIPSKEVKLKSQTE